MANGTKLQVQSDLTEKQLSAFLSQDTVAVDTEMEGLNLVRDTVCLVQVGDREGNVAIIRPEGKKCPPNLKKMLTHTSTLKVFHFAITDTAFIRKHLGVMVKPFHCTKVMSKLVRTYTEKHSLKNLVAEFVGHELEKELQISNWASPNLSEAQLRYAANDVIHLLKAYEGLKEMIENRGKLPSGISLKHLNEKSQAFLPTLTELFISGYGDRDGGWETSLFSH